MKVRLLTILVLVMSSALWAQGDNPGPCDFSAFMEDNTCGNGCSSTTFTAPYTATDYHLYCQRLYCTGQADHCRVTVTLTPLLGGSPIATCDSQGEEDCDRLAADQTITLQQGTYYTLTVCLNGCFSYPCSDCTDCVARAQVCHR